MAHQIFCPQPLQSALRLHLDPKTGYADGAWCPRSKDLSVEVLPLLTRLSLDLGPIDRITYRAGEWAPSSRRVLFLNRLVHLGWSLLQPASTISVRGTNGAHLTLLIVPLPGNRIRKQRINAILAVDPTGCLSRNQPDRQHHDQRGHIGGRDTRLRLRRLDSSSTKARW